MAADVNIPGMGPTPRKQVAIGGTVVGGAVLAWVWYRRKAAAAQVDPNAVDPNAATDGTAATGPAFDGSGIATYVNPITGYSSPLSNAQWTQQVVASLEQVGYDPILVAATIGKYLTGECVSATEAQLIQAATAYMGPPPVGSYPIHICPGPPAPPKPAPVPVKPKPVPVSPKPAPPKPVGKVIYTVRPGDNLSSIAARYHTTWQAIYNLNRAVIGRNPSLIKPGQRLVIP